MAAARHCACMTPGHFVATAAPAAAHLLADVGRQLVDGHVIGLGYHARGVLIRAHFDPRPAPWQALTYACHGKFASTCSVQQALGNSNATLMATLRPQMVSALPSIIDQPSLAKRFHTQSFECPLYYYPGDQNEITSGVLVRCLLDPRRAV